jgi:hypothetical protein
LSWINFFITVTLQNKISIHTDCLFVQTNIKQTIHIDMYKTREPYIVDIKLMHKFTHSWETRTYSYTPVRLLYVRIYASCVLCYGCLTLLSMIFQSWRGENWRYYRPSHKFSLHEQINLKRKVKKSHALYINLTEFIMTKNIDLQKMHVYRSCFPYSDACIQDVLSIFRNMYTFTSHPNW